MWIVQKGATSYSLDIFISDSAQTDGRGKTGLAYNTASLSAYYRRGGTGTPTAITLATLANAQAAYSSGGFVEIDSTNMRGFYRLDIPNAALATGVPFVDIRLGGATGMADVAIRILLVDFDPTALMSGTATAVWADSTASTLTTNVSTVLSRLGSFTGSGVNTVLGFFKALLRQDASTPSDLSALTAQAGASTTITLDSGSSSVTDFYKGCLIKIMGGTGAGQRRWITAYNGTTKVATVDAAWATNPDNTSTYVVL